MMKSAQRTSGYVSTLAIAVTLLTFPTAAKAQVQPPVAATADDESTPAQTEGETTGLGEIVVTAQRREESLQRTALAVTAVGGDDLVNSGVVDAAQLTKLVPSLIASQSNGSSTGFYLRGVGSLVGNAINDNPIALNYGQVYIARPAALDGMFYDIQRVEVLKGPQGTLYGRNATGGAINVIPNAPKLDETGADLSFEYGNYSSVRVQAAVNLPLGSNAALRVAGQVVDRDGYMSDGTDDANGQAVRASLLFDPGSAFRVTLVADYFHQGGKGPGSVLTQGPASPTAPNPGDRIAVSDPRSIAALQAGFLGGFYLGGLLSPPATDSFLDSNFWGVSANIEYDFGPATLTVIPAYRNSNPNFLSYAAGYRSRIDETSKQKSVEARLSSNGNGPLKYVLGAYYFDEDQTAFNDFNAGFVSRISFTADLASTSKALFGEISYAVMPGFRLVAGARQTWEDKTQATQFTAQDPTGSITFPIAGDLEFSKFNYKAGFEFDAGPRSLLYANVSTGFKAGGTYAAPLNNAFAPENITAYAIGSKNRFFDNRLQFNVEGFYWDYSDQQVSFVSPVPTSATTTGVALVTVNAGKSRIYGAEAEVQFQPTEQGLFSATLQYLNGKYTDFKFNQASFVGPPRTTCPATFVPSNVVGAAVYAVDCSGKPQINSPKWSLNVSYQHTFTLSADSELTLGARSKIESSRFLSQEYTPEQRQGGYSTTDLFATVAFPDDRLSITGFVNNVEDKTVFAGTLSHFVTGASSNFLRAPRTYGVRLDASF